MDQLEPTSVPRQRLRGAAVRLVRGFEGTFAREVVERSLADSPQRLSRSATYTDLLPPLAERFACERPTSIAEMEGLLVSDTPSVLFLCVHNAGRSQMAAGFLRHLAGDAVSVHSGGSEPASSVNPAAVEAMQEVGIDITDQYPKPWTDETVGVADVIVTMGCGDACPVLPGKRYVDWELDDPAGQGVEAVRPIRDDIERRVRRLMSELAITPVDA